MALFEPAHFGKPISSQLSQYLMNYTDKFDRAEVSVQTEVGTSTIRDVVYRTNALTQSNSRAILELMKIAVRNCTQRITKANQARQQLEVMLNQQS